MNDRNEAAARDRADASDLNDGELSQDDLNNVAGGLGAARNDDLGQGDGKTRRGDDPTAVVQRNDDNDAAAR